MRPQTFASAMIVLTISGCTSTQVTELPPQTLQSKLRAGEIISAGDKVRIVTSDGEEHRLTVAAIDEVSIQSSSDTIRIDDVVAVSTDELSIGKTALLAGGVAGAGYVLLIGLLILAF